MHYIKWFAISLVIFFLMDMLWLGFIAKGLYFKHYQDWLRIENGSLQPLWWAAILVYFLFALGITVFVLPLSAGSLTNAVLYGMLFGLLTYGIYDFTSLAVFKNWPVAMAFVDLIWGAFICGFTSVITLFLSQHMK